MKKWTTFKKPFVYELNEQLKSECKLKIITSFVCDAKKSRIRVSVCGCLYFVFNLPKHHWLRQGIKIWSKKIPDHSPDIRVGGDDLRRGHEVREAGERGEGGAAGVKECRAPTVAS